MPKNFYPLEQLTQAVLSLAGTGTLQERLQSAGEYRLVHIRPETLPGSLAEEFREIYQALTREEPLPDQGSIEATVSRMSAPEAAQLAERIVGLWLDVAQAYYER